MCACLFCTVKIGGYIFVLLGARVKVKIKPVKQKLNCDYLIICQREHCVFMTYGRIITLSVCVLLYYVLKKRDSWTVQLYPRNSGHILVLQKTMNCHPL